MGEDIKKIVDLVGLGIFKEEIDTQLNDKIDVSQKGANNGVATLDNTGKVPSSQLPSYVDDVLEFDTRSAFPVEGEGGKIYTDLSTNTTWRWAGSTYQQIKGDVVIGTTTGTAFDGAAGAALQTQVTGKVDKENGKGLSTNDYTNEEKQKVADALVPADIADKANTSDVYNKAETYSKTEVNNLITTPNQNYVSVTATAQTTAVTDVLPATGAADTIYRVGNWDGTQYNDSVYSEYAWNGSAYIKLSTKSQIGEVYDISANHADTKYADLAAALGTNGANIPQSLRKGGMSVKYVQSSDNKYIQARCMAQNFTTDVTQWQGVDAEPKAGSKNLVESGGAFNAVTNAINSEKERAELAEQNLQDNIDNIKDETLQENRQMVNSIMENYAPVEITGDVNNAADEEDLTSVSVEGTDVLKFKDKVYNPLVYSGLGRKILRKNIVNGVNTLTQSMINQPNTIYVIQYDFTLGEDITIPEGCILHFDGGSLSNGSIFGNETKLRNLKKSFSDILIEGSFVCDEVINEYSFNRSGYKNDTDFINNLLKVKTDSIQFLASDTYNIEINNYHSILFHTGNNIDFNNSIFVLKPNSFTNYAIFQIANVKNVTILNFSIKGDVATHLADNGEWGHGIHISNCSENIVIKNAQIDECWGDGIDIIEYEDSTSEAVIGPPLNVIIDNVKCYKNRRQGLSIEAGKHIKVTNSEFRYTGNIKAKAPASGIDIEPFSYQGLHYVEDIVIDNCIITDNCQNLSIERAPDFKILANTETSTIYFGYNNVKITNCTCDYTEVKDSYGVNIENNKFTSITLYNGDDLKFSNNNLGLLYIQNWKNVDICNNVINSKDTPQFGWRPNTTLTIINVEGIFNDNNIYSYVAEVFAIYSNLTIQNNSFAQLFNGESSNYFDATIETLSNDTQLLVNSNYFKLKKKIKLNKTNSSINNNIPIVTKNIFLNSIAIDIQNHTDNVQDLIFTDNYFNKDNAYSIWSSVGTIIAYGNNRKSQDNRIKSVNDSFILTDNEIKRFIAADDNGKLYPIALVQAIRNSDAFYKSRLDGSDSVVNVGFANDIQIPVIWNGTSWVGYDGYILKSRKGTSSNRPTLSTATNYGFRYYDTDLNKPIYWNGSKWTNSDGIDADISYYGTFSQKPTSSQIPVGFRYFCTDKQTTEGATNGIEIIHKGNNVWVDALGRVVS